MNKIFPAFLLSFFMFRGSAASHRQNVHVFICSVLRKTKSHLEDASQGFSILSI